MQFTSWSFLAFAAAFAILCRICSPVSRPYAMAVGSVVFLSAANTSAVVTVLAVTVLTYGCTAQADRSRTMGARKRWLGGCVVGIIGLLAVVRLWQPSILGVPWGRGNGDQGGDAFLILGLSFYSLQAIDYVALVHRTQGRRAGLLDLFNYLSFFPKLPAGPIEPAEPFLKQSRENKAVSPEAVLSGAKRILWGLFKKCVIADRLDLVVAPVFVSPSAYSGLDVLLAVYVLAIEIYCDFSAYCDIAIGVGRVLGYELSENFEAPYCACTIRDFWRRWHITLTKWLKRHIYLPLGGDRVSRVRWCANVGVVFLVSGLWHGATATFLVWAGLHALYYLCGRLTERQRQQLRRPVEERVGGAVVRAWRTVVIFHLVALAWVPFAASSIAETLAVFERLPTVSIMDLGLVRNGVLGALGGLDLVLLAAGILLWGGVSGSRRAQSLLMVPSRGRRLLLELALVDAMLVLLVLSGRLEASDFMYARY